MKRKTIIVLLSAVFSVWLLSCEKEKFDKEIYDGFVDYQFMVDSVDRNHDWMLTQSGSIVVTLPDNVSKVQLLTGNPYTTQNVEIAAEGSLQAGENRQMTLGYVVPLQQDTLYAAAIASNGSYLGVTPFPVGTESLILSEENLVGAGTPFTLSHQSFSYLYEVDYPYPGDFDYNDMVLRIKKWPGPEPQMIDLNVTLEAAGASTAYAAAIQLADISYKDIEKVEIVNGSVMDQDYPLSTHYINSKDVLMKGKGGQAVIRLFENVQWVFSKALNDMGTIDALHYNTTHTDTKGYSATADAVSTTYRITFKDVDKARRFTFDNIDPFLIHTYNGGSWEVHTYTHKFDEVLWRVYNNNQNLFDNHISWSLVIPKGDFRYSLEGIGLCSFDNETGERFGPYNNFSYWMQDHNNYQDWYLQATKEQLLF